MSRRRIVLDRSDDLCCWNDLRILKVRRLDFASRHYMMQIADTL